MRTRTRLTTSPDDLPAVDEADERWARGPSLPSEPRVRSRLLPAILLMVGLLAAAGLAWLTVPLVLDQTEDPALIDDAAQNAAQQQN